MYWTTPLCSRFNYRSTHYMAMNGFYNFLNWFDERAWYPLGRIVGGTVCGLIIRREGEQRLWEREGETGDRREVYTHTH